MDLAFLFSAGERSEAALKDTEGCSETSRKTLEHHNSSGRAQKLFPATLPHIVLFFTSSSPHTPSNSIYFYTNFLSILPFKKSSYLVNIITLNENIPISILLLMITIVLFFRHFCKYFLISFNPDSNAD